MLKFKPLILFLDQGYFFYYLVFSIYFFGQVFRKLNYFVLDKIFCCTSFGSYKKSFVEQTKQVLLIDQDFFETSKIWLGQQKVWLLSSQQKFPLSQPYSFLSVEEVSD